MPQLNRSYKKGCGFEQEIKRYLEQNGYLVFHVTDSHSVADLIVIDHTSWKRVYLILCRCGTAKINKAEIVKLTRVAGKYNVIPVYCGLRPGKSTSFVNMNTTTEMKFQEPR